MDGISLDPGKAAALGWPKLRYAHVERERRWLCDAIPHDRVVASSRIVDLYVASTQLRLREQRDLATSEVQYKLGRKADLSASARLITTIYLSSPEFALLAALPGERLTKTRHRIAGASGETIVVDVFDGGLTGLILAEVEFADDGCMAAYRPPDFFGREVTDDPSYTGGQLARRGLVEGR